MIVKNQVITNFLAFSLFCNGLFSEAIDSAQSMQYVAKRKTSSRRHERRQTNGNTGSITPSSDFFALLNEPKNYNCVVQRRLLTIDGVANPFNASIIDINSEEYLIAFRYDILMSLRGQPFVTKIGVCKLDNDFKQISECITLDLKTSFAEDPRLFHHNGEIYLLYNDLKKETPYIRGIHIAKIDAENLQVDTTSFLDPKIAKIEKNWVPIEGITQHPDIFEFSYMLNPHKILSVYHPGRTDRQMLKFEYQSKNAMLFWESRWGQIRGGTPAKLIDGELLAFFHSAAFDKDEGKYYFYMGAYVCEAEPPYRIKRISKSPILFPGIYTTPVCRTADRSKYVIYPCGYVAKNENDRTVLHVSCGENDSAIKIITLDKDKLYENMIDVAN